MLRVVALSFALVALGGCSWLESVAAKLPPVQLCVTYKGRQFCASKVNGVWKFDAELTADEQAEVIKGIEGN